jgi:hypothetical protein
MYEEHAPVKLQDNRGAAQTIQTSPTELANLLKSPEHHYYWTSPMEQVAPDLLRNEFHWYHQLHDQQDYRFLDPRGPSLWMGTSGSGTQCHYDVANNIIVQLHGSKRVRIFSPMVGISHLHVFPDAHPRARKSQVNLDIISETNERFPHFTNLPPPTMDVILHQGDALSIPAFWFHHIENGRIPQNDDESTIESPSISLNSFVHSEPMMIAQEIFQKGSRPLGTSQTPADQVPATLRALGNSLIERLGIDDDFIQKSLLDARYAPLLGGQQEGGDNKMDMSSLQTPQELTDQQLQDVNNCVERLLPEFQQLMMEGDENEDKKDGILLLVALHLLELWAVEMVGATSVSKAWEEALRY